MIAQGVSGMLWVRQGGKVVAVETLNDDELKNAYLELPDNPLRDAVQDELNRRGLEP